MIGRTPGEIVGRTDQDLFPSTDAQRLRDNDLAILPAARSQTLEEELDLGGGHKVVFLATKGPAGISRVERAIPSWPPTTC